MNLPVSHICLPPGFRHKNYQWLKLLELWGGIRGGVEVRENFITDNLAVDVLEHLPCASGDRISFWYTRDVGGRGKNTSVDYFGLVGLSLLNLSDRRVIITEGVSDYLSAKLCYPTFNVLGFTSLGGNSKATCIVLSLFDEIYYFADNDMDKHGFNTGLRAGGNVLNFYMRHGKRVHVLTPNLPYKDTTQQFLADLAFAFNK